MTGTAEATTTNGSGAGCTVDFTTNQFFFFQTLTINAPGQGYQVGDTLTIPGTTIVNGSESGDIALGADVTVTITEVTSGNTIVQNTDAPAGSAAA